jgi:hypothetical protein
MVEQAGEREGVNCRVRSSEDRAMMTKQGGVTWSAGLVGEGVSE